MAFTRLSLPFSLLILFSLLVIAFAADYSNDSSKYGNDGIPADIPQAKPEYEGEEKPNHGEKPITYNKPEGEEKPKYGSKPEVKPNYGTVKPEIYKPKPKEKTGYDRKPEGEEKPNYGTNQYNYKPKEEEKEKPAYENKPYVAKSKPEEEEKPDYDTTKPDSYKPIKPEEEDDDDDDDAEEEKPYSIAVEGFVYCKTGLSHYPIPGALAKVICKAVDEVGVEKTVPICSVATDAKGYFYATVNEFNLKLKDCKAFLETSPVDTCNVPTDVNKGITGSPLSGEYYRILHDKHTKLYSARSFFFTSDDQTKPAVPNGY